MPSQQSSLKPPGLGSIFRHNFRRLDAVIGVVAFLAALVVLSLQIFTFLKAPKESLVKSETGIVLFGDTNLSSLADLWPKRPDASDRQLSAALREDNKRMIQAFEDSGAKTALILLQYTYPTELRAGDESQIILEVDARNADGRSLQLEVVAGDIKVLPASTTVVLGKKTDIERRAILSPKNIGNKTFVLNVIDQSRTGSEVVSSGPGRIEILPPIDVFGIPKPYIDFVQKLAAGIGLPAMLLLALNIWLGTKKRVKAVKEG